MSESTNERTYDLTDDVAIIIGSSRGIGAAIAKRLATDGASIVVTYANNEAKAQDVVDEIERDGGDAIVVQTDVTELSDVENVFDAAENEFGKVDTVINLAKVGPYLGEIADFSEEEFDEMYEIVAKGHFYVLREAANRVADNGRIVLVSTIGTSGLEPTTPHGVHLGSKAAAEFMMKGLSQELGDRGITVNCVSPGATETEGLTLPPGVKEQVGEKTPLGRIGQPEDIADIVAFVVSEQARWLTGENIRAAGGRGPQH